MNGITLFLKKEVIEIFRTGRLFFLAVLFVLFGVMNPTIAKLTPWIYRLLSDSLASEGIEVVEKEITVMQAWEQFYKNIPVALIVLLIMFSSSLATEYSNGTLIPFFAKGLLRRDVLYAKTIIVYAVWTIGYWICFDITHFYGAYFWKGQIVNHLIFSGVCWWIFGLWMISIEMMLEVFFNTSTQVLIGIAITYLFFFLLGFIKGLKNYLPTHLTNAGSILLEVNMKEFITASLVSILLSMLFIGIASIWFEKKIL